MNRKYPLQIEKFLEIETEKALKNDINFNPVMEEKVLYANRLCNGFFEPNWPLKAENQSPCLTFAIKKPVELWLPIAIHETSHMDQYIENSPYWMKAEEYAKLEDWLDGKEINNINDIINQIILMEADCEIRTIEKIQKFDLPISIENYSQRANAYLYFHHWMKKNRKWYEIAPYEIEIIINKMPKEMKNINSYLKEPPCIIELFNSTQKNMKK